MQIKKQQLEQDVEQWTGSKLGKEYIKAVYCHPAYVTYKQSVCMLVCIVTQSCPTLCNPIDCSLPDSSVHENSPGKNIGLGCHVLLQGIFQTRESNPGLLHCRQIIYHMNHQGTSCKIQGWVNHNLESRLLGEISTTSDMEMIPL